MGKRIMKNVLIAICWLASLGVLSLHAESIHGRHGGTNLSAADLDQPDCCTDTTLPQDSSPPRLFSALNFNAPLHNPSQRPVTGDSPFTPAGLSGNPQVVAATPVLTHQPLILNSDLINGPCCYEEGIQILVHEDAQHYVISFDLASQKLEGSFNQLQLWLNDDAQPTLRFHGDQLISVDGVGAVASFRDNQLLHVQLWLDLLQQQLVLRINDQLLYRGNHTLATLQSLQFVMTLEGGATPEQVNPEALVALDNIVVSNGSYRYANLQTHVQGRALDSGQTGNVEFVTTLHNVSAHAAHNVVLTQILPPEVSVAAIDSDTLDCETDESRVICRTTQIDALDQLQVHLTLTVPAGKSAEGLTVIATSDTEEIDNHDNQARVPMGGSGSLLLLVALLMLWFMRSAASRD